MKSKPSYVCGADLFADWRDDLLSGKAPVFYPVGTGDLGRIEIGPKLVTLIGGAPGSGKTAFTMQLIVDALRMTPELRAVVCNIEMPAGVLLDRQIARLSGIDSKLVRKRQLTAEHADRIDQALSTLEPLAERLAFVRPPYDLKNVAATADHFGEVGLIVLDYLQRIKPPGEHNDKRGSVDSLMDFIRQFADSGVAMLAVSSVSRTKDGHGRSSYSGEGLSLASFRESAEIEFGADDAFILHPEDDDAESDIVRLKHLKSRHGECRDIVLRFERSVQRFATIEGGAKQAEGKPNLTAALAKLYGQTEPAGGDDDE